MILPDRLLFVGAHCDDVELIAGGLLARACYARAPRIGALVFSDHRGVLPAETAARARAEWSENLRWLAAETGATITDHTPPAERMLPACRGAFEAERERIYATLEALRDDYDLVVTHAVTDTNQDHRQVAHEAQRVCKAHATLLGGEFPSNDLGEFRAEVFVRLSAREAAAKTRLIAAYESQQRHGRPYLDAGVTQALLRTRGAQIRAEAAEAFTVLGRVIL